MSLDALSMLRDAWREVGREYESAEIHPYVRAVWDGSDFLVASTSGGIFRQEPVTSDAVAAVVLEAFGVKDGTLPVTTFRELPSDDPDARRYVGTFDHPSAAARRVLGRRTRRNRPVEPRRE